MNMSMDKPIALNRFEGTRGAQLENANMRSKKAPTRHGNQNKYMSMDKAMTLNRTEGTRDAQVENAQMRSKTAPPRNGNQNMYMSMDKPMTLNRAEGTRDVKLKAQECGQKRHRQGMAIKICTCPWTNR